MIKEKIESLDSRLKTTHPRAYPWIWFFILYLTGMLALAIFAYGMRWVIG